MDKKDQIILNLRQTIDMQKQMLDKADELEKTYDKLVLNMRGMIDTMEKIVNDLVDRLAQHGEIIPKLKLGEKKE